MTTIYASAMISRFALLAAGLCVSGCAFDVVSVHQVPTTFATATGQPASFVLQKEVKVSIGTGFGTTLRKGTSWHEVGKVAQGTVFTTRDQVVTVEASNIHEAQLVISGQQIVGFFLPVEQTFVPATPPLSVDNQTQGSLP